MLQFSHPFPLISINGSWRFPSVFLQPQFVFIPPAQLIIDFVQSLQSQHPSSFVWCCWFNLKFLSNPDHLFDLLCIALSHPSAPHIHAIFQAHSCVSTQQKSGGTNLRLVTACCSR